MKAEMSLEGRIYKAINPSLEQLGYELVRVLMIGDDRNKVLQIMIDRADGVKLHVDDCEKASHQISAVLDVEETGLEHYTLEVSSPGIDRPLTRLKDFENFKGLEAKIEVIDKIGDRRNFRGKLAGTKDNLVLIGLNVVLLGAPEAAEIVEIEFNNIKNAKLVMSDELLAYYKINNI